MSRINMIGILVLIFAILLNIGIRIFLNKKKKEMDGLSDEIQKGKSHSNHRIHLKSIIIIFFIGISFLHGDKARAGDVDVDVYSKVPAFSISYYSQDGEEIDPENWDYIRDYNYYTEISVEDCCYHAGFETELEAPEGMIFHLTEAEYDKDNIEVYCSEDGKKVSIKFQSLCTWLAGPFSMRFLTTCQESEDGAAMLIGEKIANAGRNGEESRPVLYTNVILQRCQEIVREDCFVLIPKMYETKQVFTGLYYYVENPKNEAEEVKKLELNQKGDIGSKQSDDLFLTGYFFYLQNKVEHEPYWDLEVKIKIPDGLEAGEKTKSRVTVIGRDRYLIFNKENYVPTNESVSKMSSPLVDSITAYGSMGEERDWLGYQKGSCVFGADLDLHLAEKASPNKTYNLLIQISYTNFEGRQTQAEQSYSIQTENFQIKEPDKEKPEKDTPKTDIPTKDTTQENESPKANIPQEVLEESVPEEKSENKESLETKLPQVETGARGSSQQIEEPQTTVQSQPVEAVRTTSQAENRVRVSSEEIPQAKEADATTEQEEEEKPFLKHLYVVTFLSSAAVLASCGVEVFRMVRLMKWFNQKKKRNLRKMLK